jgi:hypothetical protein
VPDDHDHGARRDGGRGGLVLVARSSAGATGVEAVPAPQPANTTDVASATSAIVVRVTVVLMAVLLISSWCCGS